jgi:hypothetical protein
VERDSVSIRLTPFTVGELCSGCSWHVDDDALLAEQIATVALGQFRHIERVIAGAQLGPPATVASATQAAISMLTVQNGGDPSQRDGWMFQIMSWIAAHYSSPGGLIRTPHLILAHKGFDGLQLELDAQQQLVTAAIIFEDKATSNPRDTIREEVWPEFSKIESGAKDHVLIAEVVGLLLTRPAVDPDAAIKNVIWNRARRYRVSVTVSGTHATAAGRETLFRRYDAVVTGATARRRGETFEAEDLRAWMEQLAEKVICSLRAMGAVDV